MEKNSRLSSVSNILIILLFAISCYFIGATIFDKGRIDKLEAAIKAERDIATGFEYTNRELRQDINELYGINSKLEITIRGLRQTEYGFEAANYEFGKGLEELRRINKKFGETNQRSGEGIEKIEKVLNNLETFDSR